MNFDFGRDGGKKVVAASVTAATIAGGRTAATSVVPLLTGAVFRVAPMAAPMVVVGGPVVAPAVVVAVAAGVVTYGLCCLWDRLVD